VQSATTDDLYRVDQASQKALYKDKPWRQDAKYFNAVHISALALIKIVMHAKTGQGKAGIISQDKSNWIEVMGMVQGHVRERAFIITDSFGLPVDANEVECSLSEAAQMYLIDYVSNTEKMGRQDHAVVGWYHSHPGYSPYLSGTDVPTQKNNQLHQDPFIALVVDPVLSLSTGRVEIKAFRTYPENYVGTLDDDWDRDSVPQSKIEEFGAHFNSYYQVPITVFRSTADAEQLNLLWNQYWMQTLSASPLVANRHFTDGRLNQLIQKMERAEQAASHASSTTAIRTKRPGAKKKDTSVRDPVAVLSSSVGLAGNEVLSGVLTLLIKDRVFNVRTKAPKSKADP